MAQRVDVIMTDFPTAIKVTDEFDWADLSLPEEKLAITPYAYVVPPGDQIWLNYINLFVDTIKLDGRLHEVRQEAQARPDRRALSADDSARARGSARAMFSIASAGTRSRTASTS